MNKNFEEIKEELASNNYTDNELVEMLAITKGELKVLNTKYERLKDEKNANEMELNKTIETLRFNLVLANKKHNKLYKELKRADYEISLVGFLNGANSKDRCKKIIKLILKEYFAEEEANSKSRKEEQEEDD